MNVTGCYASADFSLHHHKAPLISALCLVLCKTGLTKLNVFFICLGPLWPSFHLPCQNNFSLSTGYSVISASLIVSVVHQGSVPGSFFK